MKSCRTDIKILLALQQDVPTCSGNLIYGVRLQLNVGDRLAKKIMRCCIVLKINLKKVSFVPDGHFREDSLNFNFSITSNKPNYGDMFFLPKQAQI